MARLLAGAGFVEVYCTPHRIRGSYDATSMQVRKAVATLQTALDKAGISLQLHSGREHYLDEFLLEIVTSDPHPLGESNLLLVELPHHCDPEQVKQICYRLTCDGYRIMIAHPERSPLLSPPAAQTRSRGLLSKLFGTGHESSFTSPRSPLLEYLQKIGCAFQGNLGSLYGQYGERVRQNALILRSESCYTHWGSDGHGVEQLKTLIAGC